jgi:NAD(P)-dependent dehydrogenase (short-subunit alcohol dehydrogenase family)
MWRQNALGGFLVGREAVRRMLPKGSGTILYTGATASLRARPPFLAFASAKAALRAVAQGLAREFGPQGIHVAHVVIDGVIAASMPRAGSRTSLRPRAKTGCSRLTRLPTPTGPCTASRAVPGRTSSTSDLLRKPSEIRDGIVAVLLYDFVGLGFLRCS